MLRLLGSSWLFLLLLAGCDRAPATVFTRLDATATGVTFTNRTGENDTFNILTNEYIYNGGGVGVGDFDGDGNQDLFFTGNEGENELYLNRGNWRFDNVSEVAGIGGGRRWNNGVTVVDVNTDGRPDIYVCASVRLDSSRRANQLFLNQGPGEDGVPRFTDVAPAYGLDDTGHNTQAAWFDYDLDGDLDVFLLVNEMVDTRTPNEFNRKITDGTGKRTDRLYRQDREGDRIRFTEVGKESGILLQGFALAATVCDLNLDGMPDLYVSNDYLSNDVAYLNTIGEDGRHYFRDIAPQLVKHTSYSAMGNDVVDVNNDGLPDILTVDMLPADNLRRKMMLLANNYTYLLNLERYGYQPQFVRNTLQLSEGRRPDSLAELPLYREVAMQAGLPATDWSWTPLVADFDLDGDKDVIVTNGFPRDITDKDFSDYSAMSKRFLDPATMLPKIPSVEIPNVAFRSSGGELPRFERVSRAWGIDVPSFSSGAAYADLDNDGDLDYVVSNIDAPAHLYRNNSDRPSVRLRAGEGLVPAAYFGATVTVRTDSLEQTFYWHPHRGYLSSGPTDLLVAVPPGTSYDVEVLWPGGERETFGPYTDERTVTLHPGGGRTPAPPPPPVAPLLQPVAGPDFRHEELDYVDFNVQPMLLRKLSEQGPAMAVTDWNNDGLDDVYVGGSYARAGSWLAGTPTGLQRVASRFDTTYSADPEELGALFFDADGDGDDDLYLVSGSYEFRLEDGQYDDRLFLNEGGRYTQVPGALVGLPTAAGSCVRAADYDGDGDLDLFVGSRVAPHRYPEPVASYLLRNESGPAGLRFVVDKPGTAALATATNVCDALFTDFDGDDRPDLLLAGEWAPLRAYRNTAAGWTEVTAEWGLGDRLGLWNGLAAGDFDNDGDTDYLAGNFGQNTILDPSPEEPLTAVLTDLDDNGTPDFIPFAYFEDTDGQRRAFPFFNRNDFVKQVTKVKGMFPDHNSFARAGAAAYQEGFVTHRFTVNDLRSYYLENTGTGFRFRALPAAAQSFPVFGMLPTDLNEDDYLDLLLVGNDHGVEVGQGHANAGNGLTLLGRGDGRFDPVRPDRSGFFVPGEGRGVARLAGSEGPLVVAAQNSGPLLVFRPVFDTTAPAHRRQENYHGSGYLGQSQRTPARK